MDHSYSTHSLDRRERERLQSQDHSYFSVCSKAPKVIQRKAVLQDVISRSDHTYGRANLLAALDSIALKDIANKNSLTAGEPNEGDHTYHYHGMQPSHENTTDHNYFYRIPDDTNRRGQRRKLYRPGRCHPDHLYCSSVHGGTDAVSRCVNCRGVGVLKHPDDHQNIIVEGICENININEVRDTILSPRSGWSQEVSNDASAKENESGIMKPEDRAVYIAPPLFVLMPLPHELLQGLYSDTALGGSQLMETADCEALNHINTQASSSVDLDSREIVLRLKVERSDS